MKDLEICKLLNLSNRTLTDWKKAPSDNWRAKIYHFFATKEVEEIKPDLDRIESFLKQREETNAR